MAKQASLAGMEDRKIPDLHAAAEEYVDIRDKRMELTKEESRLKEKLLGLMKKHKRKTYSYDDVTIDVVVTEEKVKVKIASSYKDNADED